MDPAAGGWRRRGGTLLAVASVLALGAASVPAAAGAAADGARASGKATVSGPAGVVVGRFATFRARGLDPGARYEIWLIPTAHRGGNCCGIRVRRARASDSGALRIRFRWPRTYHRCAGVDHCTRTPWRAERADVVVLGSDGEARTTTFVRQVNRRLGRLRRCGFVGVPEPRNPHDGFADVVTRQLVCPAAGRILRGWWTREYWPRSGPRGWRCASREITRGLAHRRYRCKRPGGRELRFSVVT